MTGGAEKILSEIAVDVENPEPMNRLLQGDVGSGKTIIALVAMLIAFDCYMTKGYQSHCFIQRQYLLKVL